MTHSMTTSSSTRSLDLSSLYGADCLKNDISCLLWVRHLDHVT
ncbi:Hypothetical protein NGAL_HAMBI1146_26650 [Neorhizobium galegae bv. officinalis]|nr:Hypothetical protein NGAL_HAMBI1146_26650 [Neorhizobium galegae bv. officinalis]